MSTGLYGELARATKGDVAVFDFDISTARRGKFDAIGCRDVELGVADNLKVIIAGEG